MNNESRTPRKASCNSESSLANDYWTHGTFTSLQKGNGRDGCCIIAELPGSTIPPAGLKNNAQTCPRTMTDTPLPATKKCIKKKVSRGHYTVTQWSCITPKEGNHTLVSDCLGGKPPHNSFLEGTILLHARMPNNPCKLILQVEEMAPALNKHAWAILE